MDIARYIGLFLLKNNFCYIPGLGNIEIKKIPAAHTGQALQSPAHEVIITPGGSIDDSLANFVATNEKISIASASNAIRTFVMESKKQLQAGEEVNIPSLGNLTEAGGKLRFITDANFKYTPPPIPTIKHAPRSMDEVKPVSSNAVYQKPKSNINWGKTILIAVIAGVVVGAIAGGIAYVNKNEPAPKETVLVKEPAVVVQDTSTTVTPTDTSTPPVQAAPLSTPGQYKVIIGTYKTKAKAEKRVTTLTSFGNTVEMVEKDSTTYYVVMPMNAAPADTTRILDSLSRVFNPKGVSIYR